MMPIRSRPEGCLSDYALDRRLAGEGENGENDARVEAHLAVCGRCARRWEEIRAEQKAFAREPSLRLVERRARLSIAQMGWLGVGSLAMAAAVMLFLRLDYFDPPATRAKGGGLVLGLYVNHAGEVRRGGARERVEPGDALRFVYTTREASHLAILSFDGARHASVYYPAGPSAALAAPGSEIALPSSTVLDDVVGPETLYAVACPEPFSVEPLRRTLEASGLLVAPAGCDVDTLPLRKEAPILR